MVGDINVPRRAYCNDIGCCLIVMLRRKLFAVSSHNELFVSTPAKARSLLIHEGMETMDLWMYKSSIPKLFKKHKIFQMEHLEVEKVSNL